MFASLQGIVDRLKDHMSNTTDLEEDDITLATGDNLLVVKNHDKVMHKEESDIDQSEFEEYNETVSEDESSPVRLQQNYIDKLH